MGESEASWDEVKSLQEALEDLRIETLQADGTYSFDEEATERMKRNARANPEKYQWLVENDCSIWTVL
ncbi:hypothetical protein BJD55_gp015 [Gordonia phage Yvonnetastic]|uniref:Uncharacterized protein n=1 Tax=Gordonia phage Yvonnetastic TaxID=1821566 RepID=A0A142K8Y1_9CAUD|nr:hypothetical protein BJD55_gp015 [Gordonia phage Yvonnetastic]AMS02564.1 hypothetical protein SEA_YVONNETASTIC_15 [Gordonia phage Yvonnetastic]